MVNSNDVVHRMVTKGDFSMAANIIQTLAPAIDIQVPQSQSVYPTYFYVFKNNFPIIAF